MNTTLIIIGASGHGKVIADLAETLQQYKEIYFLDDDPQKKSCMGYQVIGTNADIDRYVTKADFVVAIGNAKIREKILEGLLQRGAKCGGPEELIEDGVNGYLVGDYQKLYEKMKELYKKQDMRVKKSSILDYKNLKSIFGEKMNLLINDKEGC